MATKRKKARPAARKKSITRSRPRSQKRRRSLLSPKATGGVRAWTGFRAQTRYIALRVGEWLAEPTFASFQPERSEDVDVRFGTSGAAVRDYHQVKSGDVGPVALREIIRGFLTETGVRSARQVVVASPHFDPKVRSLLQGLDRSRSSDFVGDPEAQAATGATVRDMIRQLKLTSQADFILDHLYFYQDFGAILGDREAEARATYDRIAMELRRVDLLRGFSPEELAHAARQLVISVDDGGSRTWGRAELLHLLRTSAEEFRAGAPRSRADLLLVRHDSVARSAASPDRTDLPELFNERRILPVVELDQTTTLSIAHWGGVGEAVQALARTDGRYRGALAVANSEVLYFGLPHVPLAALAGYIARQHRHIHVVEHDRSVGRFRWRDTATFPPLAVAEAPGAGGSVAVVRVSISANVLPEVCRAVIDPAEVRLELDFSLPRGAGGRGAVQTEAQARAYAEQIRRSLDLSVAGHPEFTAIHVFAAVPVSVAFLLGQALSGTALPETWVHNYRQEDRPAYKWSIGLHGAERGVPGAVRVQGE